MTDDLKAMPDDELRKLAEGMMADKDKLVADFMAMLDDPEGREFLLTWLQHVQDPGTLLVWDHEEIVDESAG